MRVFVDTNVYLSFIELSQEKSDSLGKLRELIKDKKFDLLFPKITQNELFRRVPVVSVKQIAEINRGLPTKPQLAVSARDAKIKKEINNLYEKNQTLIKKLENIYHQSTERFIKEEIEPLIKAAANIHENDELVKIALNRRLKGNPPGKRRGPIGDEIEWEIIMRYCTDDDLVIITNDGDWKDPSKEKDELNPILVNEWLAKTTKKIEIYSTLSEFIAAQTKKKVTEEMVRKEKEATEKLDSYLWQLDSSSGTVASAVVSAASVSPSISPSAFSPGDVSAFRPVSFSPATCRKCGKMVTTGIYLASGEVFCKECYPFIG